jgi:Tfp pilus assembly protein PilZ
MKETRHAVPAIIETVQRLGWEFDIQTVDRGVEHACLLTNLFHEGQLVVSRRAAYPPDTAPLGVRELMRGHHARLLADLHAGALDQELRGVVTGDALWLAPRVVTPTAEPRPALDPQQLTSRERATVLFEPSDGKRPTLFTVVLQEPRAFLDIHYSKGTTAGVLLETQQEIVLGQPVDVAVRFLGRPIHQFLLGGVVAWRRRTSSDALKPGLGVDIPPAHRVALERVVEFALGIHDVASDRQFPRVRCMLSVKALDQGGQAHAASIINLSEGGAYVIGLPALKAGDEVTLVLKRGLLSRALRLRSRIRWARPSPQPAVGVMFALDGPGQQSRVAALVEELMAGA